MIIGESEARKNAERTKLNVDRLQHEIIRSWMLGLLKIKRKVKKHPKTDIRRFFNG